MSRYIDPILRITRAAGLVSLFMLSCCLESRGQQFNAGLIAGMGGSQISGDNLQGFDKLGFLAGGYVTTTVSEKFDICGQLIYITKGSKKNSDPEKGDYTSYRLRLTYVEMPLLLEYKYNKRFHFQLGPTLGALLSDKEEDEYGIDPVSTEFKPYEFGYAFSLLVTLKNGLAFNGRYGGSILPVREHQSGQTYRLNRGQYNSSLMLALQYTFKSRAAAASAP